LWNEFVAPVAGYGIRGTAWIQGEQNCNATASVRYAERFNALIKGWRRAWGQGDFPFYFGQLSSTSGSQDPNNTSYVAVVREGQRMALVQPNTAMSVNMDIGIGGWHYANKPEAGRRLALPALAMQYGQDGLEYSGPLFSSMTISGKQLKVVFSHTGGGLVSKTGDTLSGFTMAEATGNWVWAHAVIKGDTVILESALAKPTKARYAWADRPRISLFNKIGLPASPFSTENGGSTTSVLSAFSAIPRARTTTGTVPANLDALGRRQRTSNSLFPWAR
jgi:sialate O-acetylesterase